MKPLELFNFGKSAKPKNAVRRITKHLDVIIDFSNRMNYRIIGLTSWLMFLTFLTTLNFVYLMIVVFWRE